MKEKSELIEVLKKDFKTNEGKNVNRATERRFLMLLELMSLDELELLIRGL